MDINCRPIRLRAYNVTLLPAGDAEGVGLKERIILDAAITDTLHNSGQTVAEYVSFLVRPHGYVCTGAALDGERVAALDLLALWNQQKPGLWSR